MRTKNTIVIVPLALICLCAAWLAEDIIARLGLQHENAQNYILANFTGGFGSNYDADKTFFSFPRTKALPQIIAGDKVGAAKELCDYVKRYLNSEEFARAYQEKRESSKPTYEPEPMNPETMAQLRTSVQDMETELANMKKSPKENAQTIALYEPMLKEQKAMLAEYEDPAPNKTKWERNFPADPSDLVRRKLQAYLDLEATVDYNAKLTPPDKYKISKFANPAYEAYSPQWKACFRAGKEVNMAVRAFVQEWMKGEIISANKVTMQQDTGEVSAVAGIPAGQTPASSVSGPAGTQDVSQDSSVDTVASASKQKKSLLGKIKDKAKNLIKD